MIFIFIILYAVCFISESKKYDRFDEPLYKLEEEKTLMDGEEIFDSYLFKTDIEDYPNVCDDYDNENCAKAWLEQYSRTKKRNSNRQNNADYGYYSNISKETGQVKMKLQLQNLKAQNKLAEKLSKFRWQQFRCPRVRRIFKLMTSSVRSTNKTISKLVMKTSYKIKHIYNNARPCYKRCLAKGELEIVNLFRNERDYDVLAGFWSSWRSVTGRKIRDLFIKRMQLENIGAKENGYSDIASFNLKDQFEEDNFDVTILSLFEDILPLYEQLHGFVRYCLSNVYPGRFDIKGPIPAHILGDLWAQKWHNILPIIQRCRGRTKEFSLQKEVNKSLSKMSVKDMYRISEDFYKSIGMNEMTDYFWNRSIIVKEPGRLIDCHGAAFDMRNEVDFRILMCTEKTFNDFSTIHHEMGHIEYYMAYRSLNFPFQGAANPSFHEAVGDTIALSVKTPTHLKRIGLIPSIPHSKESDIDYLLGAALEKVVFLPFALTMESYIWGVYNGSVTHNKLNEHWWNLRYRFQGLKPPNKRTEEDFDPAGKYHLAFGISYIRYFLSFLLQYQFFESMCELSGFSGPLHTCDFYGSKVAGGKLLEMLKKGKSQHWKDSLEILTGRRTIESKSITKFFEPLYEWLKETNKKLNVPIGW